MKGTYQATSAVAGKIAEGVKGIRNVSDQTPDDMLQVFKDTDVINKDTTPTVEETEVRANLEESLPDCPAIQVTLRAFIEFAKLGPTPQATETEIVTLISKLPELGSRADGILANLKEWLRLFNQAKGMKDSSETDILKVLGQTENAAYKLRQAYKHHFSKDDTAEDQQILMSLLSNLGRKSLQFLNVDSYIFDVIYLTDSIVGPGKRYRRTDEDDPLYVETMFDCAICYEDVTEELEDGSRGHVVKDKEGYYIRLPCGFTKDFTTWPHYDTHRHIFCFKCIQKWAKESNGHECPCCKQTYKEERVSTGTEVVDELTRDAIQAAMFDSNESTVQLLMRQQQRPSNEQQLLRWLDQQGFEATDFGAILELVEDLLIDRNEGVPYEDIGSGVYLKGIAQAWVRRADTGLFDDNMPYIGTVASPFIHEVLNEVKRRRIADFGVE